MKTVVIRFRHSHAGYSAGEVAGFPEKVALRLIDEKVATLYTTKSDAAQTTSSETTKPARSKIEEPATKSKYVTK